jgi:hypothetical protein
MLPKNNILLGALVVLTLASCTSVKKELGVGRNSPDEFAVVKRAPLTVPPDFTLRAPDKNDDTISTIPSTTKEALLGTSAPVAAGAAENAFMDKLGVAKADAEIRSKIDADNGYLAIENKTVSDKLIFWDDTSIATDKTPASVIDAKAEAERIKANQAAGKPINEGTVPTIEKKKNTLDKIF